MTGVICGQGRNRTGDTRLFRRLVTIENLFQQRPLAELQQARKSFVVNALQALEQKLQK